MRLFDHGIRGAAGVLALLFVLPAAAQENLDQGKTAAQLFASDCAICHKTPQGLAKNAGLFGVESFLREHYTASRESAAAIAKYLAAQGDAPPPPVKQKRRSAKKSDKKSDKKSTESKPADAKSKDMKKDAKAEEAGKAAKSTDAKPAEAKVEPKTEAKTQAKTEPKSAPKSEAKPEAKSEVKPAAADKPVKSD